MLSGLTALVIESQSTVAAIVIDVLKRSGIQNAILVQNCEAALEINGNLDLILVDLRDWLKGTEAFEKFADNPRISSAILGLMSSSMDRAVVRAARVAPCHFVILKPFGPIELRRKLSTHIDLPRMPILRPQPALVPQPPERTPSAAEPLVMIGDIVLL